MIDEIISRFTIGSMVIFGFSYILLAFYFFYRRNIVNNYIKNYYNKQNKKCEGLEFPYILYYLNDKDIKDKQILEYKLEMRKLLKAMLFVFVAFVTIIFIGAIVNYLFNR